MNMYKCEDCPEPCYLIVQEGYTPRRCVANGALSPWEQIDIDEMKEVLDGGE